MGCLCDGMADPNDNVLLHNQTIHEFYILLNQHFSPESTILQQMNAFVRQWNKSSGQNIIIVLERKVSCKLLNPFIINQINCDLMALHTIVAKSIDGDLKKSLFKLINAIYYNSTQSSMFILSEKI